MGGGFSCGFCFSGGVGILIRLLFLKHGRDAFRDCHYLDGAKLLVLLMLLGQGWAICELLLLEWGWAAHGAPAPQMRAGFSHSCCSSDGCGLLMRLLLLGWVQIVCGCCFSNRGGLLAWLLLLVQGQAAPWTRVGCSCSCCFSDRGGLHARLLFLGWGSCCSHSCCSLNERRPCDAASP